MVWEFSQVETEMRVQAEQVREQHHQLDGGFSVQITPTYVVGLVIASVNFMVITNNTPSNPQGLSGQILTGFIEFPTHKLLQYELDGYVFKLW